MTVSVLEAMPLMLRACAKVFVLSGCGVVFVLLSESALSFQGVIYAFTSWVTCLAWRMWRSWLYLFSYFNFEV